MSKIKQLQLMASGDASKYLKVSNKRLHVLVKNYGIPHQRTSAGMIFLKEDLDAFQVTRKDKMKHGIKKRQ